MIQQLNIDKCIDCNLCLTRRNTVGGYGNINANLMIIGDTPGATEDRLGIPFSGKSGTLLRLYLEAIGINIDNTFVTHIVKCRPILGIPLTKHELTTCHRLLKFELNTIKPKIILILGLLTLKQFTKNEFTYLEKYKRQLLIHNHTKFIITNSISAGLRYKKLRQSILNDFMILHNEYKKINPFIEINNEIIKQILK